MANNLLSIAIEQDSDIVIACSSVKRMVEKLGMSLVDSTLCATAVSELATNIVRYADKGRIVLQHDNNVVRVIAKDQGPGIADISLACQEGYSGGNGLGMGLSGIARIMDTLEINSTRDQGTCITTSKFINKNNVKNVHASLKKTAAQPLDVALRVNPIPGEQVSGDGALLIAAEDNQFMALWDVSGHGLEAHQLSEKIKKVIQALSAEPPQLILKQVHEQFLGTRGLVAVIARVSAQSGWLEYSGVGNVSLLHIHPQGKRRLSLQEGVMGYQIRTPKLERFQMNRGDTLIMHTDGIATIREPLTIQPQTSASALCNTLVLKHRATQADDASCIVLRYKGGGK